MLVKLVRYTAALIDCSVSVEHVKIMSSPAVCLADDLTYYHTTCLFLWDPQAYYALESGLAPVQLWMTDIAPETPCSFHTAVLHYSAAIPALTHLQLQTT